MSEITTIGLDLAKNVFQFHGADHPKPITLETSYLAGVRGWASVSGWWLAWAVVVVCPSLSRLVPELQNSLGQRNVMLSDSYAIYPRFPNIFNIWRDFGCRGKSKPSILLLYHFS